MTGVLRGFTGFYGEITIKKNWRHFEESANERPHFGFIVIGDCSRVCVCEKATSFAVPER